MQKQKFAIVMERCWENMSSNAKVVVGVVVEKDGKYLLVQEAKASCRGKWNLPAGHLDPGETIIDGAKREAKEETGSIVEPINVCQIGSRVSENDVFVIIIFIAFDPKEILAVRWFSYEEILAMKSEIRNEGLILDAIGNSRNGLTAPIEIVNQY